jgi:uracil-DNA glycosylase
MEDSQPTTYYLEDIDPTIKSTSKRERLDDDSDPQLVEPGNSSTITPAPVKRQRTLGEMFSGAHASKGSESTSSIASDGATASASGASGLVKLNSIPFSMTAYLESLSDEEKRLLQLECEVLGKSW